MNPAHYEILEEINKLVVLCCCYAYWFNPMNQSICTSTVYSLLTKPVANTVSCILNIPDMPLAAYFWFCAFVQHLWCVWVCVLLAFSVQLLDVVIAHSRVSPAPFPPLGGALWLLTADCSHQQRCMYGLETQPAGIWEEQSRICAHKSDRCMVCHYLPLIIILSLFFILWATLAQLKNICTVAL